MKDPKPSRGRRIGLLHHIGGGNLGDDATQDAVIQNVRRRWPDAVMIGFSMNPADSEKRHGIRTYAIRRRQWKLGHTSEEPYEATAKGALKRMVRRNRVLFGLLRAINLAVVRAPRTFLEEVTFLFRSFRVLKSLDLLIINGGGQLTEWGGPWQFPYTIFKWVRLARLAGVRCVFLNVGAGPLTRPLSQFFVRRALRSADYVSFRDEQSRNLARQIGFKGGGRVFPDSAYGLEISAPSASSRQCEPGERTVGLAPMPYCDPRTFPEKDQAVYDSFIQRLGLFGSALVRDGYRVMLFGSDIGTDPPTIADLRSVIEDHNGVVDNTPRIVNENVSTLDELLAKMSRMDYVVTCRFHGIVFAHMLNKPVLAVSHHPKMATLMNDLGLGDYCLDIRTFDLDALTKTFAAIVADADEIKARMAERLARYRQELGGQLDELFPRELA